MEKMNWFGWKTDGICENICIEIKYATLYRIRNRREMNAIAPLGDYVWDMGKRGYQSQILMGTC